MKTFEVQIVTKAPRSQSCSPSHPYLLSQIIVSHGEDISHNSKTFQNSVKEGCGNETWRDEPEREPTRYTPRKFGTELRIGQVPQHVRHARFGRIMHNLATSCFTTYSRMG